MCRSDTDADFLNWGKRRKKVEGKKFTDKTLIRDCMSNSFFPMFYGVHSNYTKDTKCTKFSVDKKNQLDVTFCILYFSSNSCSTCFGQLCAHHQELRTA